MWGNIKSSNFYIWFAVTYPWLPVAAAGFFFSKQWKYLATRL